MQGEWYIRQEDMEPVACLGLWQAGQGRQRALLHDVCCICNVQCQMGKAALQADCLIVCRPRLLQRQHLCQHGSDSHKIQEDLPGPPVRNLHFRLCQTRWHATVGTSWTSSTRAYLGPSIRTETGRITGSGCGCSLAMPGMHLMPYAATCNQWMHQRRLGTTVHTHGTLTCSSMPPFLTCVLMLSTSHNASVGPASHCAVDVNAERCM